MSANAAGSAGGSDSFSARGSSPRAVSRLLQIGQGPADARVAGVELQRLAVQKYGLVGIALGRLAGGQVSELAGALFEQFVNFQLEKQPVRVGLQLFQVLLQRLFKTAILPQVFSQSQALAGAARQQKPGGH